MNKQFKRMTAVVLLLCLSIMAVACGRTATPKETTTGTTTLPVDTTQTPSVPDTQTTEPTDHTGSDQEEATRPTLETEIGVGSGRVEGTDTGNRQEEATTPTTKPTDSNISTEEGLSMTYQQYIAMSSEAQQAFFFEHFQGDALAFHNWFQKIKQEYEDETPEIIATGPIDIEDYINSAP